MNVFNTDRPKMNNKYNEAIETAKTRKARRLELRQELQNKEREALILESLSKEDNDTDYRGYNYSVRVNKRSNVLRNRSIAALESRLVNEGYNKVMNNIIFGIVYEAFWADENVKSSSIEGMYESYETVMSILETLNIKPVPDVKQNQFIKNLREIAMETCKKSAKKTVDTECGTTGKPAEAIEDIVFGLDSEDQSELDTNLSELSADDMAQLVKNKVLQVVQDEQMSGKAKQEIIDEIDSKKKELDEDLAGDDVEHSDPEDTDGKSSTEESVSLTRLQLKSARRHLHRVTGNSLFESIMMGSVKTVTENVGDSFNKNDIMDGAFMETMLHYTVLETLNTIGLYNFTREDVNKIQKYYKS